MRAVEPHLFTRPSSGLKAALLLVVVWTKQAAVVMAVAASNQPVGPISVAGSG